MGKEYRYSKYLRELIKLITTISKLSNKFELPEHLNKAIDEFYLNLQRELIFIDTKQSLQLEYLIKYLSTSENVIYTGKTTTDPEPKIYFKPFPRGARIFYDIVTNKLGYKKTAKHVYAKGIRKTIYGIGFSIEELAQIGVPDRILDQYEEALNNG